MSCQPPSPPLAARLTTTFSAISNTKICPPPPPRPAAVDQDRAPRRERRRHRLALQPKHSALGRVEAEALQSVAAEPHDAGPRYQVRGAPVARRRRKLEHFDCAHSQRLRVFPFEQVAAPPPRQASHFPARVTAPQLRKEFPEARDQGAPATVFVRLVFVRERRHDVREVRVGVGS